jgi:hypothetical protein
VILGGKIVNGDVGGVTTGTMNVDGTIDGTTLYVTITTVGDDGTVTYVVIEGGRRVIGIITGLDHVLGSVTDVIRNVTVTVGCGTAVLYHVFGYVEGTTLTGTTTTDGDDGIVTIEVLGTLDGKILVWITTGLDHEGGTEMVVPKNETGYHDGTHVQNPGVSG